MILSGDIGGTKVNLAFFDSSMRITEKRYESRDFSGIEKILDDFLKNNDSKVEKACFGVACRIINGKCLLTNLSWQVEVERLKEQLGIDAVKSFWAVVGCRINPSVIQFRYSIYQQHPVVAGRKRATRKHGVGPEQGLVLEIYAATGPG